MKHNFTIPQIEAAKKFVKELHDATTNVGATSKIENIKLFKNSEDVLFISYNCIFYGADGTSMETFYIKIDEEGKVDILNYTTTHNPLELAEMFEKLEPITL